MRRVDEKRQRKVNMHVCKSGISIEETRMSSLFRSAWAYNSYKEKKKKSNTSSNSH